MMDTTELIARLDAMDAKLDYIVERQRFTESFIRDMTPVGREAMNAMAEQMAGWEERGWFAMGGELLSMFDRLANAYGPDDVHEVSEHVVQLVDTVRNLTQPDVLDLANDATDVIHHADDVKPVGAVGMAMATRDPEVQRGLAVALEVLRQIGRARGGAEVAVRPSEASAPRTAAEPSKKASAAPAPSSADVKAAVRPQPVTPEAEAVVEWEGCRFTTEGYLVDPSDWDEALASKMAEGLGIALTDDHWVVLRWARGEVLSGGASPNVRRIAAGSGVGTRRLYELFPGTPGKSVAMVAGIPKPVGCV